MILSETMNILLVEDDPGDIRLVQEMLKTAPMRTTVTIARDGVQALARMKRIGSFLTEPQPDLVLLDLNLPKLSGHDVLTEMKNDALLRNIPVVVLTTSTREQDIATALAWTDVTYLMKPFDLKMFLLALKPLKQ